MGVEGAYWDEMVGVCRTPIPSAPHTWSTGSPFRDPCPMILWHAWAHVTQQDQAWGFLAYQGYAAPPWWDPGLEGGCEE